MTPEKTKGIVDMLGIDLSQQQKYSPLPAFIWVMSNSIFKKPKTDKITFKNLFIRWYLFESCYFNERFKPQIADNRKIIKEPTASEHF